MTIHYEAEEFIVQDDTQWVVYNDTINTIIQGISQSDTHCDWCVDKNVQFVSSVNS